MDSYKQFSKIQKFLDQVKDQQDNVNVNVRDQFLCPYKKQVKQQLYILIFIFTTCG